MENKKLPQLCDNKTCTGCLACVNACNHGALTITKDDEGFYRPRLNAEKCIMCGLCEKSCPILNKPHRHNKDNINVFASWHTDDLIRKNSSSGGAFTALAETILKHQGTIIGAAYNEDMVIEHMAVDNIDGLRKLRLSKYAQSNIGNIFNYTRELLRKGLLVMFVGTPCQIAGLKSFLKKDYENLLSVDFICHGVPSIDFFTSYLEWLEPKTGKPAMINFRDKRKGWYDNLRVITNTKGKTITMKGKEDAYWVAFNRNNCLQESCYKCEAQGFPRCSDITLADFWCIGHVFPFGHKGEIEKGISMIVVSNPQKQNWVDEAKNTMYIERRSIDESIAGNSAGVLSSTRPQSRDFFYKDLKVLVFSEFRKKYMIPTKKETLVKFFREYLPFWFIKFIRLMKQK